MIHWSKRHTVGVGLIGIFVLSIIYQNEQVGFHGFEQKKRLLENMHGSVLNYQCKIFHTLFSSSFQVVQNFIVYEQFSCLPPLPQIHMPRYRDITDAWW